MPRGKYFRLRSQPQPIFFIDTVELIAMSEVVLREYSQADHQLWFEDPAFHVIRNKGNPDLVLEENADGFIIINHFEKGNPAQGWQIKDNCIRRRDDDTRVIAPFISPFPFLEWRIPLQVVQFTDKAEEKWNAIHIPANDLVILNDVKGRALTIATIDCLVGSAVIIQDNNGDHNQIWYEDKFGVIRSKFNDYTFDVDEDAGNGTMVVVDVAPGFEGAKWVAHEGSIINRHDPQQCVQLSDIASENGTFAEKAPYSGNSRQKWKFTEI